MTDPKEKGKPVVKTREPKKLTSAGIFDNLRQLPHPVEELLGLTEAEPKIERAPLTSPTPPTPRTSRTPSTTIAPERDFAKVANSILREAVAGGYFTGKSKQLYDFLYSRTRGAIVPTRSVKITKPRLMRGSSIGSERTLLKNLNHLQMIGLIKVIVTDGGHSGNEYMVMLPEEVDLPPTPPTPPTPPIPLINSDLRHPLQKVGGVPTLESGVGGVGLNDLVSDNYRKAKTSFKTKEENLDDDAALAGLNEVLKTINKELTGKDLSRTEADRWHELAEVLVAELKIAAARTTISSVPSFLAEHLRRRLWKLDKKQAQAEGRELPDEQMKAAPTVDASKCPDCGGSDWWYPDGAEKGVAKCKHANLVPTHS